MFDAQQTAALMTMYPMMKPAIDRFEKESVNMDGTSVLTVATLDVVASAEQAAAQAKEQQEQQSSAAQARQPVLAVSAARWEDGSGAAS